MLEFSNTSLRLLENTDLDFLFEIENNPKNKKFNKFISTTSRQLLKDYIKNAQADISVYNQIRFVVENKNIQIGLIDLFEYDPEKKNAGVGIIINSEFRNKNFGSNALKIIIDYSFQKLDLIFLFANIKSENKHSIKLFEKFGFIEITTNYYRLDK
jgi:diamine N-acetyltransferase|tara:strand:+ start:1076 stop:1543 length:468 start_codon:yes stop_codon:yes gene_type:complete